MAKIGKAFRIFKQFWFAALATTTVRFFPQASLTCTFRTPLCGLPESSNITVHCKFIKVYSVSVLLVISRFQIRQCTFLLRNIQTTLSTRGVWDCKMSYYFDNNILEEDMYRHRGDKHNKHFPPQNLIKVILIYCSFCIYRNIY